MQQPQDKIGFLCGHFAAVKGEYGYFHSKTVKFMTRSNPLSTDNDDGSCLNSCDSPDSDSGILMILTTELSFLLAGPGRCCSCTGSVQGLE